MKKSVILYIVIILMAVSLSADIKLLQPKAGDVLKRDTLYPIRWLAPASQGKQIVTILIEKADESKHWLVDSSRTKGDRVFYWTVGQLNNGVNF